MGVGWTGVTIAIRGLTPAMADRLGQQVGRFQQARRQQCLSLLQPTLREDGLIARLAGDPRLAAEARDWAGWLVGAPEVLHWYRRTLARLPSQGLWRQEQLFYARLRGFQSPMSARTGSSLWRWHPRHGLDLGPWLGQDAAAVAMEVPVDARHWLKDSCRPVLGQWLCWEGEWLVHLFLPMAARQTGPLPYVAAALIVPPLAGSPANEYQVQQGDTLWGIAARKLGQGRQWQGIYARNRARVADPHWIYPGQRLILSGDGSPAAAAPVERAEAWVVRRGDTLWRLAEAATGRGQDWPALWLANRSAVSRPERLPVGLRLRWPESWALPMPSARQPAAASHDPAVSALPKLQQVLRQRPVGRPRTTAPDRSAAPPPQAVPMLRAPVTTPDIVPVVPGAVMTSTPPPEESRRAVDPPAAVPPSEGAAPQGPAGIAAPPPAETTTPEGASPASMPVSDGAAPATASEPASATVPEAASTPVPAAAPVSRPTWHPAMPLNRQVNPEAVPEPANAGQGEVGPTSPPPAAAQESALPSAPIQAMEVPPERESAGSDARTLPLPSTEPPVAGAAAGGEPEAVVVLPPVPTPETEAITPASGGTDPWDHWLHPGRNRPVNEHQVAFSPPLVGPRTLWPRLGYQVVPEYLSESGNGHSSAQGWAVNRQRLDAEWGWGDWLMRGRWTFGRYELPLDDQRVSRQESWVDLEIGQHWQPAAGLQLSLLGRGSWWQRRGAGPESLGLLAADVQGFGLGPVGSLAWNLFPGQTLVVEAAAQPLIPVTFSGTIQASGQVGQLDGYVGWCGQWGMWRPHLGYRSRWLYDADGTYSQFAHGLSLGLSVGWAGI